jgi:diguanylate cyclase (GGDEF)-like protein
VLVWTRIANRRYDTDGHLTGDDCLCQIAIATFEMIPRPRDTIARYGGEEFVVILPDMDDK